MLASQLIHTTFPILHLHDKVSFTLQLMDDYDVTHLAIKNNDDKFCGIVSKDDLYDFDETEPVQVLIENYIFKTVKDDEHFLEILKVAVEKSLSLVPIVNTQQEILGCINIKDLLQIVNNFVGNEEKGGVIVLEMDRRNFSFGELSRLVETNDAYVTQLNTSVEPNTGVLHATIKVNKIEISDIVATFQRFDYNVKYYFGEEQYANELEDNFNHLMKYLNI